MLMLLTERADDLIYAFLPGIERGSTLWVFAYLLITAWPFLVGFILDLAFGDPRWLPHPIKGIGWIIKTLERILRGKLDNSAISMSEHFLQKRERQMRTRGLLLAIITPFAIAFLTLLLLLVSWQLHFLLGLLIETLLCWLILAARSLKTETKPIQQALEHGDIESARERLSWLVGRDTEQLNEEEVSKAAVETIAENTNDGVVAPLLYLAIGGPVLGMAYKAINTLDSMVGYTNERYINFGKASAKLDDFAGFIPARIAAHIMLLAVFVLRMPVDRARQIFHRDRMKHLSPNSAQTEAVCAGALGIELGGSHLYNGKMVYKPGIGDNLRPAEPQDIFRAQQLMLLTSILACVALWLLNITVLLVAALIIGVF